MIRFAHVIVFSTFLSTWVIGSDVGLTPVQMIEGHGYPSETHYIKTEDGYILTYYRIPHGIVDDSTSPRPTVLLQHGFISSAADYVNMGPGRSLGYILADAGYDVWLGNARGNTFSRNHTIWSPDFNKNLFFDFSWHEIGYYDYPAAIDYILNLKGDDSLYYVGHSQGTTSFLVLASTRPEYNKKIKLATLLAPAGHMGNPPNAAVKEYCMLIDEYAATWAASLIFEIPNTEAARIWGSTTCVLPVNYADCAAVYYTTMGIDITEVEPEMLPVIATNAPADAAIKELVHYGQIIKTGNFAKFDYGMMTNLMVYGSMTPPLYDLSKITAPVAFYYATNDGLLSIEDVKQTISEVSNVAGEYLVPLDAFNHYDFLFAKDVVELLYNEVVATIKKF
ncbi:lipase 3-like [Zophobas morio]|uniref:lipase 3-like n=1 Tax=Zophobas morio TaxID=2755281 RepID=UPI00308278BA